MTFNFGKNLTTNITSRKCFSRSLQAYNIGNVISLSSFLNSFSVYPLLEQKISLFEINGRIHSLKLKELE